MCLFCVTSTHWLTWFVFFGDALKDLCSPRTDCLMACFRVSVKVGHGALEFNSSARTTKRNWVTAFDQTTQESGETLTHSNMTCHINYASSLIPVSLYYPKLSALGRLCSFQSVLGLLIHSHPLWQDTQGHFVVDICTIKLLSWLTVSTFSPLSCVPFSLLLRRLPAGGRAHPHLQLLFGDQGAESRQEAGGTHLLRWLWQ